MKAVEVLSKLIGRAYWWCTNRSSDSIRNHTAPDWEPGRMVEKLSPEEREALKELTSEQVSGDNVSEEDVLIASSSHSYYDWKGYTQALKEAKCLFDAKIKRHIPGRSKKY